MQHKVYNAEDLIAELGRKYVWWAPVGEQPHAQERIIAQVMNLGTYDDIRRLEDTAGLERLAEIMLNAAPGWLSDRSWEFWRGRLSVALGKEMPAEPPRRSFNAAVFAARTQYDFGRPSTRSAR